MRDELIKLIYYYEINEKYADPPFVKSAVNIIAKQNDLKEYVRRLRIKDSIFYSKLGLYYPKKKRMVINIRFDDQLEEFLEMYRYIPEYFSETLTFNLNVLNTIIHEMDHALMEKEYQEGKDDLIIRLYKYVDNDAYDNKSKNPIDYLFNKVRELRLDKVYDNNHDFDPGERRAIVTSNLQILDILNGLKKTDIDYKNIRININAFTATTIADIKFVYEKKSYGFTNSPSFDFCNKISKIVNFSQKDLDIYNKSKKERYKMDASNFSFEERILYGLQLSNKELDSILNSREAKENEKEIKKLIRKFK